MADTPRAGPLWDVTDWAGPVHKVPIHTIVMGTLPGWQIALIAVGAALLASAAVAVYRARAVWRRPDRNQPISEGDLA